MTLDLTLPPIVERELRVASRRGATYWSRVGAASTGVLFVSLLISDLVSGPSRMAGPIVFRLLAVMAAVTTVGSVLQLSAEAFAREKREDTLGLLFLTPLRPVDLVIGKLVSTSLLAFYRFLALVPLLAVPLLAGGVTFASYLLLVLALIHAVFLAATLGLYVSARSWDEKRSATATTAVMAFLTLAPALSLAFAASLRQPKLVSLFALSPAYPIWQSTVPGAAHSGLFWLSLLWTQLLGWTLFAAACRALPRGWQQRPENLAPKGEHLQRAPSPSAASLPVHKIGHGIRRQFDAATRAAMLEREPCYWLATRFEPSVASGAWVIGALAVVGPVAAIVTGFWGTLFNPGMALASFFLVNAALKTHAANLASRALARGQAEDPLELLLSTPMKSKRMILGQRLAFRKALEPMVRHILWIEAAWMFLTITFLTLEDPGAPIVFYVLASLAVVGFLVPDLSAIGWTGLWRGVAARSARDAEQEAFSLVAMLPWLPVFLSWMIANAVMDDRDARMVVPVVTWMIFSAWVDHWFSRRSQRLLETRMKLWAQRRAAGELDHYDGWRAAGRWLGRRWHNGFYPTQPKKQP